MQRVRDVGTFTPKQDISTKSLSPGLGKLVEEVVEGA